MNVIVTAAAGVVGPQWPVAMLARWTIVCAATAALLVGWGRMIYCRLRKVYEESLGTWTVGGAGVGVVVGLAAALIQWLATQSS
jgi:hypothetical protein